MRLRLIDPLARAAFTAVALLTLASLASAGASDNLQGLWLTEDGDGVIDVAPCGSGYCGRIVGMSDLVRPNGHVPSDPQGYPQCGLTILRAQAQTDTGVWSGRIENPDDGSVWNCELWVENGELHLRGYVLVPLLGKTQIWKRYAGTVGEDCRMLR